MGQRINLPVNTKRKLSWFYTDGNCCLCSKKIGYFEHDGFIGEFAHIIDLQQATLRYDSNKKIDELNSVNNIMVLCPNCHTRIDKESEKYSTSYLMQQKQKYENNILISREYSNPEYLQFFDNIFKELKGKYQFVSNRKTLLPIPVKDKIARNSLSSINDVINIGLSMQSNFVDYLYTLPSEEKIELRKIVIEIYLNEIKNKNISNEDKFNNMVKELVGNNTNNYLYAITILAYYFEECDVFET